MPIDFATDSAIELYRFAFEHAPDPTAVLDEEGRILLRNEAARAFPEVVEGLVAGGEELELFRRELARRGCARLEVDLGGRSIALDGRAHGAWHLVTFRDRSEQRSLEVQLRAMQRADSLGPIGPGLAHDFNNLLTPISHLSSCLEAELPHGDRAWRMARDVRIAAEKAVGLARRTLGLVRREPARVRAEPVCVNAVLADMRTLIERVVGEEVQVEVEFGHDAGAARLDRGRLEGALLDLAVNARDAMKAGGRLTVTTTRVSFDSTQASPPEDSSTSDYVCLRMTDTGSGMTPEVRARIFEPFFTTKDPGRGTGLGLPAVRRFVMENGGCIAVHSQPGQGTTMALYFPSTPSSSAAHAAC
ncbi:MAG TPA: ATP-binding protein [Polyangiaceae bacterium]|nr:ATP-binding protein [Polyangiaceae bacterium]